jgi:ribosomal protein L7/L12
MTMPQLVSKVADLEQRVEYLEQLMTIRPWQVGSGPTAPGSSPNVDPMWQNSGLAEVRDLVRRGKKIEAIKRYRELTHCGLKEAKDAIDAMETGL